MTTSEPLTKEYLRGEWQQPINRWASFAHSVHNEETAASIGLRGGPIPGTVHLGHFRPLLMMIFGERWYRRGSISMFYTFATTHKEDVRAVVDANGIDLPVSGHAQFNAWVETPEGKIVCKGTVAAGDPGVPPYIRSLGFDASTAGATRILANLKTGSELQPKDNFILEGDGEGVLNPTEMYSLLHVDFTPGTIATPALGMFGATEIVLHAGPVRIGVPYCRTGKIVHVGVSPKTEFAWTDSWLHDKDGVLIAEMRHMTRWFKVSSPLWNDGGATASA